MSQGGKIVFILALILIAGGTLALWYTRQDYESAMWKPRAEDIGTAGAALSAPAILVTDPAEGHTDPPITIIEFSDFRCPHCADAASEFKKLFTQYPDKLRLIWKDFPTIPPRENTLKAHIAARCAYMQGKFWQYHDELFARQEALTDDTQLTASATAIGMDTNAFQSCLTSDKARALIDTAYAEGQNLHIDGTPTLFVNGEKWNRTIADIATLIK